jgi:hypothetical protein
MVAGRAILPAGSSHKSEDEGYMTEDDSIPTRGTGTGRKRSPMLGFS